MAKKHDKGLKNIGERIKYIRGSLTQPEFGKKLWGDPELKKKYLRLKSKWGQGGK